MKELKKSKKALEKSLKNKKIDLTKIRTEFDPLKKGEIDKEKLKEKIRDYLLLNLNADNESNSSFWIMCSGISEEINKNEDQYENLVKAFDILTKKRHPFYLSLLEKIDSNLHKSFTYFEFTEDGFKKLKKILKAFIVRNSSLNYCQNLNIIAAYILKATNFKEKESFYLLLRLMENILPYDFYLEGKVNEAELSVVMKLINECEDFELDALKDQKMELTNVISQFITSLLIYKMDSKITIFMFNCFFGFHLLEDKTDGSFYYLYKIILGIFYASRKQINSQKTSIIEALVSKIGNDNKFIKDVAYYTFIQKNEHYSKRLRNKYIIEIKKLYEERKCNLHFKNEENIECNIYYPMCLEECNHQSYIVPMRASYKDLKDNNKSNENEIINIINDDYEILKNIVVERRRHFCCYSKIFKKKYKYCWKKVLEEVLN